MAISHPPSVGSQNDLIDLDGCIGSDLLYDPDGFQALLAQAFPFLGICNTNDVLLPGPKILQDLHAYIWVFR